MAEPRAGQDSGVDRNLDRDQNLNGEQNLNGDQNLDRNQNLNRRTGDDLDEQLVEILRPEFEAAEAVLTEDQEQTKPAQGGPEQGRPEQGRPEQGRPGPAGQKADSGTPPQTTDKDFFHALGGWGALLDIGLPWIAFLIVYGTSDQDLRLALIVAIACGAVVAVLRLIRKQPLRNVLGGFVAILISAAVASRSGRAEDVYLVGLLTNVAYGVLYLVTVLIRWPLFGVLYGLITQTGTAWRRDPAMLRAFTRATLVFAVLFALRLIVQVPLYLTGTLNALGIAKVGMGLPMYALALWLAYGVLRNSMPADKWDETRTQVTQLLGGGKKK